MKEDEVGETCDLGWGERSDTDIGGDYISVVSFDLY